MQAHLRRPWSVRCVEYGGLGWRWGNTSENPPACIRFNAGPTYVPTPAACTRPRELSYPRSTYATLQSHVDLWHQCRAFSDIYPYPSEPSTGPSGGYNTPPWTPTQQDRRTRRHLFTRVYRTASAPNTAAPPARTFALTSSASLVGVRRNIKHNE